MVINPLPGSFISYHRRGNQNSISYPVHFCHKLSYLPFILLRAHSSLLEIIYSPLRSLHSPPPFSTQMLLIFKNLFILFLAALGVRCCTQTFSSCGEWGLLFVAVHGLLIAVASLAAEHRLQACGLQQLWHVGSVVVARGLSCFAACGVFPSQGLNPCPLHWQADS